MVRLVLVVTTLLLLGPGCSRVDRLDRLRSGPLVVRLLDRGGAVVAEARLDGDRVDVTVGELHGIQVGDRLVLDGGATVPGVPAFDRRTLLTALAGRADVEPRGAAVRVDVGDAVLELSPG